MSSPAANRRRRYLTALLIFILTITGSAVGWMVGQYFVQAKLNGIDDFGELLIVSLFYEAGVYDLLPVGFAAVGGAIATALVAVPLVLVRIVEVYRRMRTASYRSREELLKVNEMTG